MKISFFNAPIYQCIDSSTIQYSGNNNKNILIICQNFENAETELCNRDDSLRISKIDSDVDDVDDQHDGAVQQQHQDEVSVHMVVEILQR